MALYMKHVFDDLLLSTLCTSKLLSTTWWLKTSLPVDSYSNAYTTHWECTGRPAKGIQGSKRSVREEMKLREGGEAASCLA